MLFFFSVYIKYWHYFLNVLFSDLAIVTGCLNCTGDLLTVGVFPNTNNHEPPSGEPPSGGGRTSEVCYSLLLIVLALGIFFLK